MLKFILVLFLAGEPVGAVPTMTLAECQGLRKVALDGAPKEAAAACFVLYEES
jgi:hypothetical protein